MLDRRPLTGDTLQDPRAIAALPFVDVEDSSRFTDHYSLDNSSTSPRVEGGLGAAGCAASRAAV